PGPLVALTRRILPQLPALKAVIFEITATFLTRFGLDGVRRQISELREVWEPAPADLYHRDAPLLASPLTQPPPSQGGGTPARDARAGVVAPMDLTPEAWEDGLAALVVGRPSSVPVPDRLAGDPGVDVLRRLVWNFRSGVLVETLGLTCRLLLLHGGDPLTRDLFDGFFQSAPPQLFAAVEAEAFGAYLAKRRPDVPYLDEVLGFDLAAIRAVLEGRPQLVPFRFDPASLLEPLARGRLPVAPIPGRFEVEVTPEVGAGHTAVTGLLSSS
ncbi:MAG TPA: hypothetical protein VFE33_24595, partial [Thermoanaerobaculia bacterium]|nr:hypothetical protein [Thermoanaerobaculia bacterium]